MRTGWSVVLALVLAGCAGDGDGPGDETPSPSPTPVLVVEDAPTAGHPLGITNQTPLVVLGPGGWDVTFEGAGTRQFVLRLAAELTPRGYSIGGALTILLVPVDFRSGPCAPSEVNFIATGIGGFSETWSNPVPRGDYLLVVDYEDDASGSFTWQVGDSDDQHALDAEGEPSPWTRRLVEPTITGGDFEAEVPAGFHFLNFRASTGLLTSSSSIRQEVQQGGVCHVTEDSGTLQPLGGGHSLVLHAQAGAPVTWTEHFESQSAGQTQVSAPSARGVVLAPPA